MPWAGVNPPQDPADYDPANKTADPVLYLTHREAKVAEEFVKVAEAKVRDELAVRRVAPADGRPSL